MLKFIGIGCVIAMGALNVTHGIAADIATYDKSKFSQKQTLCDRLAAYPPDRDRVAPGLNRDQINVPVAIMACEADVKADQTNPRLHYQLARLFGYQKNDAAASVHRQVAIAAGYPIAIFVSGYERAFNVNGDPDRCVGAALMLQAARAGAYAGQVGLTAYTLAGAFRGCPNLAPPEELEKFLAMARPKAEGHFETLLLDSLLRELSSSNAPSSH